MNLPTILVAAGWAIGLSTLALPMSLSQKSDDAIVHWAVGLGVGLHLIAACLLWTDDYRPCLAASL